MKRIVSSAPGRIRVRDKNLRDQTKLNTLKKELSTIAAITELHDNVRTGSMLVRFDPNLVETAILEVNIESAADQAIGKPSTPLSLLTKKSVNRYNKLAMLATLGASLAFTASHRKRWRRWHALTGNLFIANLGVHLYIYRKAVRRLFR